MTNPPIDHLREELVFSLAVRLGRHPNLLVEEPAQARVIELPGPVLTESQMAWLRQVGSLAPGPGLRVPGNGVFQAVPWPPSLPGVPGPPCRK